MRFADWLTDEGWTHEAFGAFVHRSRQTVCRWARGQRTPHEEDMRVIYLATDGQVTPNDFYPLEQWRRQLEAKRAAGTAA